MATPTPKSYDELLGQMLQTYMAKISVNDLNTGSAVLSFFEAVAQHVYLANASNFSILRDYNLDRATGEALKRIAIEERISPIPARVATGRIAIIDESFEKIETKVYAGAAAPNIGSNVLKVSDASNFPSSGKIIVGRGTNNVEGPIDYTAVTPVGGYYELTLASSTSKYHNISESVILAQGGNRSITAGTVVVAPSAGGSADISFTTTQAVIMLDGENYIGNIPVAAQKPGTEGNVARYAIKEFSALPFTGAKVQNESRFTTGRDIESDDEIRVRVKRARLSKGLGTATAVRNSVIGAQANDEAATITSAEIFSSSEDTILYIDNGEGYEEKTAGVGLEYIVDYALGGETNFQLATGGQQSSVAKAFIETNSVAPFAIAGGYTLAISVGGVVTEHSFSDSDFKSPLAASTYEIVSSINANPNLDWVARTSDNTNRISFFAKAEEREYISVVTPSTGIDASINLSLPSNEVETLRLYKNDKLLSKNGKFAIIETNIQSAWDSAIGSGDTLEIAVDNTSSITYTFIDDDFIAEGSGNFTVDATNSLESWANVFNAKITGVTTSVVGNQLQMVSNLGANSRAKISIVGGTLLNTRNMFSLANILAVGAESDYTFSRNTAQFKLKAPLEAGDKLSAGTDATKGVVMSGEVAGGAVTFASDAKLWILLDDILSQQVVTGVVADSIISVSKVGNNTIRYTSATATAFNNVSVGNYINIWSLELSAGNRVEGRVHAVTSDTLDVKVTADEYALAVAEGPLIFKDGFTIIDTNHVPQKIVVPAGNYSLFQVAEVINEQLVGGYSFVKNERYLNITTKTESDIGSILIVDFNDVASALSLTKYEMSFSDTSLFGFYMNETEQAEFPLFVHSKMISEELSDIPTYITDFTANDNLETLEVGENNLVVGLNPFASANDTTDSIIKNQIVPIESINGQVVEIKDSPFFKRIRLDDRFYIANPFDFSEADSVVTIFDGDITNKTFSIPLYRRATTDNSFGPNSISFRAFDSDSGASAAFSTYFGSTFDFSNYKVMMQAKNVLHPTQTLVDEDAILIKSTLMGLSGETIKIGYFYPESANASISHSLTIADQIIINIFLKSGNTFTHSIQSDTEWDVTITPDTGFDFVTYTWNSVGTNPDIQTTLSSGGYVTINDAGEFNSANIGTFRVSSATTTSFTVIRRTGAAVTESGIASLTDGTIRFYAQEETKAIDINDYINNNLADFVQATIIDDNGLNGEGSIDRSTYEDSDFTYEYKQLVDGQNYIKSSNLTSATAQFVFKRALSLPSFNTATPNAYNFSNGEVIKLIPTTIKQIADFINVLAVSGASTIGNLSAVVKDNKLQIKSDVLGSNGAVQIVGGRANSSSGTIQQAASQLNGFDLTKLVVERAAIMGTHTGQWIKIEAENVQKKAITLNSANIVETVTNPTNYANKTKVTFSNRQSSEKFFGKPRNFIRDVNRTFKVEQHGKFTAIIWDEQGSSPNFSKTVEINDYAGIIDVTLNGNTTVYTINTGDRQFIEANTDDTVTFSGFLQAENNGTFRIQDVSDDGLSLYVDNEGVEELGTSIGLGGVVINAEIKEGDTVQIGEPFASGNQGTFRVVRRFNNTIWIENEKAVEEDVTVANNAVLLTSDVSSVVDVERVDGGVKIEWTGGTDPSFYLASRGDVVTLTTPFNAASHGSFVINEISDTYIVIDSALAVDEASVLMDSGLSIHQPSMKFYDYESTVNADSFVVAGDVLGNLNVVGQYVIEKVLSRNSLILNTLLINATTVLGDKLIELYVNEKSPYVAYKRIQNRLYDPVNINNGIIVVEGSSLISKINKDIAVSTIKAMSKFDFPTTITKGIDSYRYHTGLLRQANRIVYGDPRSTDYEGVAAAGAEIFIQPPLIRRIQVSIVVRLNTGIPFNTIVESVRNNVSALINATGIGQSIAISDIVETVNTISGVFAVSISSPAYSPSNDVILINPSEKPLVIDANTDIVVSKIGL